MMLFEVICVIVVAVSQCYSDPRKQLKDPIVHSDIAAVSHQIPPVYSATEHWTHTFHVAWTKFPDIDAEAEISKLTNNFLEIESPLRTAKKSCDNEANSDQAQAQMSACSMIDYYLKVGAQIKQEVKTTLLNYRKAYDDLIRDIKNVTNNSTRIRREVAPFSDPSTTTKTDTGIIWPKRSSSQSSASNLIPHVKSTTTEGAPQNLTVVNNPGTYISHVDVQHVYQSPSPDTTRAPLSMYDPTQFNYGLYNYNSDRIANHNTNRTMDHMLARMKSFASNSALMEETVRKLEKLRVTCKQDPTHPNLRKELLELSSHAINMPPEDFELFCNTYSNLEMCQNKRVRRKVLNDDAGVLSYEWSFAKWMWGAMDNTDAMAINDEFKKHAKAITTLDHDLRALINSSLSATVLAINDVNHDIYQLTNRTALLEDNFNSWTEHINKYINSTGTVIDMHSFLIYLNQLCSAHTLLSVHTERYNEKFTFLTRALQELRYGLQSHELPLGLFSQMDFKNSVKVIGSLLGENLKIIPHDSAERLFLALEPTCVLTSESVQFIYSIPVIDASTQYQTWRVSHIPFPVTGVWMDLHMNIAGVNYDKQSKLWQSFTTAELALCENDNLRVCPFPVAVKVYGDDNCIIQLIEGTENRMNACLVTAASSGTGNEVFVLPVKRNTWLLTTMREKLQGTMRCPNKVGTNIDESVTLSTMQIIHLEKNCVLTVGTTLLIASNDNDFSSTENVTYHVTPDHALDFQGIITPLSKTWKPLPGLALRLKNMSLDPIKLSQGRGLMSLKDLRTALNTNSSSALNRLLSNSLSDSVNLKPEDPPTITRVIVMFLSDLLSWPFVLAQIIIDLIVVFTCIRSVKNRLFITAAVMNRAQHVPLQTYAAPLVSSIASSIANEILTNATKRPVHGIPANNSMLSPPLITLNSTNSPLNSSSDLPTVILQIHQMLKNITVPTQSTFEDLFKLGISSPMIVCSLMMIMVMIICHWRIMKSIKAIYGKVYKGLDGMMLNETIPHHAGECKIILIVNVAFVAIGYPGDPHIILSKTQTNKRVIKQIALQLCTLPGTAKDWVCTIQGSLVGLIHDDINYRYSSIFSFRIKYGPLCIRLRKNIKDSACEDMPSVVRVRFEEVIQQAGGNLPKTWYKACIIGVSSLIAKSSHDIAVLYKAGNETEGNRMARIQGIPLEALK